MPGIDLNAFAGALARGATCLDLRAPAAFLAGHVPGALALQFGRQDLGERAELFVPRDRDYVVLMEPPALGPVAEKLLTEAGYRILGFLPGGFKAWQQAGEPVASIPSISVHDLHERLGRFEQIALVDVREDYEFEWARVPGSINVPHGEAWERVASLDPSRHWHVICNDQVRSCAAASVLRHLGLPGLTVVLGGTAGWLESGYEVVRAG